MWAMMQPLKDGERLNLLLFFRTIELDQWLKA